MFTYRLKRNNLNFFFHHSPKINHTLQTLVYQFILHRNRILQSWNCFKKKKKLSHFPNLRNWMLYCIKPASADNILVVIGRWYVPFDFLSFISYICLWFNFKDVSKFTKRKFPQEFDKWFFNRHPLETFSGRNWSIIVRYYDNILINPRFSVQLSSECAISNLIKAFLLQISFSWR